MRCAAESSAAEAGVAEADAAEADAAEADAARMRVPEASAGEAAEGGAAAGDAAAGEAAAGEAAAGEAAAGEANLREATVVEAGAAKAIAGRAGAVGGGDGGVGAGASERGAALVIALLLLVILSLVAVTGMRTSIAEVWMAGSEQFHRAAVEAASAGVEVGIAQLRASRGASVGSTSIAGAMSGDGEEGSEAGAPRATYAALIRPRGTEASILGSSAEKFIGEHFEIESIGNAPRAARDDQVQGVLVISSSNGVRTFRQIGAGLGTEPSS